MKLEPEVKKDIAVIGAGCLVCTLITAAVFLIIGRFSLAVFLGLVVGFVLSFGNFLLMAVGMVRALANGDETEAKTKMRSSYTLRMIIMLAVIAVAVVVEAIDWIPVVAAVFYPRIVIMIKGWVDCAREKKNPSPSYSAPACDETDEEKTDEFEKFVGSFHRGKIPGEETKDKNDGKDK